MVPEEDEVPSTLPNRCLMNCFILIQSCFSPPFSCSWDAVPHRQPWLPRMQFEIQDMIIQCNIWSPFGCGWDEVPDKQPWPPPVQFVILGDGVQVRPTPWPSFSGPTMRFKCNVCTSLMLLDSEELQQSVQMQALLKVPWPPPVWKFLPGSIKWFQLPQWLYPCQRQQYMFLTKSLSTKIIGSLNFKLGHRWRVEGLVYWIYCNPQYTLAGALFLLHHLTVRRIKMLIVSWRVLILLGCMCNMMIQSMQLHDDVFCRIFWLDSYASSMYYNCRDYAWFKVIWQLFVLVIPTYFIQLKRGGLAQFDFHSLFHEFGISCWGLDSCRDPHFDHSLREVLTLLLPLHLSEDLIKACQHGGICNKVGLFLWNLLFQYSCYHSEGQQFLCTGHPAATMALPRSPSYCSLEVQIMEAAYGPVAFQGEENISVALLCSSPPQVFSSCILFGIFLDKDTCLVEKRMAMVWTSFTLWFSSTQSAAHDSDMNLRACITRNLLSCFSNMMISEIRSVPYMVLPLYIFRHHTVRQNHQRCSPDTLLGSHLVSFQGILIWAWSNWISILIAQVGWIRWCSRNSYLGARPEQLLLMGFVHLTTRIHVLSTWSLPPQNADSLISSRCVPVPPYKLMGTKDCSVQSRKQRRHPGTSAVTMALQSGSRQEVSKVFIQRLGGKPLFKKGGMSVHVYGGAVRLSNSSG